MTPAGRMRPAAGAALLAGVATLVLGLRFAWASQKQAEWFQSQLGYYFVLALWIVAVLFFLRIAAASGWLTWSFWRPHRGALLVIAAATLFLHLHEPHVMRVLYDEPTHALVALSMHLDRSAMGATVSNYVGGTFTLSDTYAVSRQYLFPMLVSLLHDLTGYRVANVFVLNFLLTPAVLLGAWLLGYQLAGAIAGYVAVGLLATFPLLSQAVTSGSYDVLNMALVGALTIAMVAFVQSPEAQRAAFQDLSLAAALLLAVARSESVLYLLPWALVTLVVWRRERRVEITRFAIVSPLFLLPSLMSNMLMMRDNTAMRADLRQGGEAFFALGNLPAHISEAVFYFFSFDRDSTNSALLGLLGLLGFVALIVQVGGALRRRRLPAGEAVMALFAVWTLLVYLFVLTLFWSSPVDPLAARFCLPLMLVWSATAGWLVAQNAWLRDRARVVYAALVIWGVVVSAPMMSRAYQTRSFAPAWADAYFVDFAKTRDRTSTLYLAQANASMVIHRFASGLVYRLRLFPEVYVRAIKAGVYHDVIVLQTLEGTSSGNWEPRTGQELPGNIVLETIDERMVGAFSRARISRLVGYRKADGTLVTPSSDDPAVRLRDSFKDPREWQRYRLSLYP